MKLLENKNYIYVYDAEIEQIKLVMKVNKKNFSFEVIDVLSFNKIKGLTEISETDFKTKYYEPFYNQLDAYIDEMFENPIIKEKIINKVYQIKQDN